ncbi:hypothetical protein [Thermomonas sp.]|uniref:hypothetical protein n=1 Tax=Thermomonas sp. TaxID=1971895 RepID=UPI002EF6D251
MKLLKKIALAFVVVLVLSLAGGYVYFDRKFSPAENALDVVGSAEAVPIHWQAMDGNAHAALLLPVKIRGIDKQFFMQLDFGAPSTILYRTPLQSIRDRFPTAFALDATSPQVALGFGVGGLQVSSRKFALKAYGSAVEFDKPDAENIIGTLGADVLEKRVVVLDMKRDACSFVERVAGTGFVPFEFKKRKILLPATLGGTRLKLLYDSGSSGYQLITTEENWKRLRTADGSVKVETGNSWGTALKVVSAPSEQQVLISGTALKLSEVTYVEGMPAMQRWLMKGSGMEGMVGNALFLGHILTLDARNRQFKIE